MKRLFDLIMAGVGLLLISPVLLIMAVWVKLDSSGPVFYKPLRGGREGKHFHIYKFRSMVVNADRVGGPTTAGDDPRVTRSGHFIRRFKLDELSQLINVLIGDMSLVGPRPEIVEKVERYNAKEMKTMKLRPGITDWASIWNSDEGGVLDGAVDADAVYEEIIRPTKMDLQLHYYKEHSFIGDLKILFSTVFCIGKRQWRPKELDGYPSFDELRARALIVIKRQKNELQKEM